MNKLTTVLISIICFCCFTANSSEFPKAVIDYLDKEIPKMEKAVENKDMEYFKIANDKNIAFLKKWGLNSPTSKELEKYPQCADIVMDYVIVGLCKVMPPKTICEPETFFSKFELNVKSCKLKVKT